VVLEPVERPAPRVVRELVVAGKPHLEPLRTAPHLVVVDDVAVGVEQVDLLASVVEDGVAIEGDARLEVTLAAARVRDANDPVAVVGNPAPRHHYADRGADVDAVAGAI